MWMHENPCYAFSSNQYGFVEGKSTVDALRHVVEIVENAFINDSAVVAVSLDIENAFNSLPWETIRSALCTKNIPEYLRRIIDFYLYQRSSYTQRRQELNFALYNPVFPRGLL